MLGASGGAAGDAGFMLSASSTTVIGFSLAGTAIPVGSGVLVTLELAQGADPCLSGLVLSGSGGTTLDSGIDGCTTVATLEACDDVDEDGVCDDVDDCVGAYDDCGDCNGGNAADLGCGCY